MKPPTPRPPAPPAWALRFLEWYCNPALLEEIEGDLNEAFAERVAAQGLTRARLLFILDVFRFIRPFALRREPPRYAPPHLTDMLSNYSKIAWRNLAKNKVYSAINIAGLSIGLACCLTIGLYIQDEVSHDRFHPHAAHLYRVVEKQVQSGNLYNMAVTPGPLAPALKTEFADIEQTCRLGRARGVVQLGKVVVEPDKILVTDNAFFDIFGFKLLRGNPRKALLGPGETVLTEAMAAWLFGAGWRGVNDMLGRQLTFNDKRTLTVAGVAENPPANSHIQFDMLLSVRYDETAPEKAIGYNWDSNNYHTYIRVQPDARVAALGRQLEKYLARYNPGTKTTLHLQPLRDIYLHSDFAFHTDWSKTSSMVYIRIFAAVGTVVLLIALFNFINLATARAVQRAREVGVRKAIGAYRGQLVVQFLGESLLMTGLATCLALLLLRLFLPLLNDIAAKSLSVPYGEPAFWLAMGGFTGLVGLLAGLYPAFYLSRFRPARVLKGVFDVRSGQLFRRTLVVGQFTFSVILVIGAIVIYRQLRFLQDKHLGFDGAQLVHVWLKNELPRKSGLLKADLQGQAGIAAVTQTSNSLVDMTSSTSSIAWEGQQTGDSFIMTHLNVDPDFVPATGMQLVAGRNFDPRMTTDTASAYLVNETAVRRMGWKLAEAPGKRIKLWDREGTVVGVVRDFHFRPLTAVIEPFLFRYWPKEGFNQGYSHLLVRTKPGQTRQALAAIERFYKKHEHLTAPRYEFVDEALENQYRTQQRTGRVVLYFSVLAVFVSCLGLLGLATFTAEQRTKEIGIRKVLGASVGGIVMLLSKDFLKLVGIAVVIASPVAWYAAHQWLQDFAYKIDVQWWMFAGAGLLAAGIALLTVSYQAIRTALINPVKSLRTE